MNGKNNETNKNMALSYGIVGAAIIGTILRGVTKHTKKKKHEAALREFTKTYGDKLTIRFGKICNKCYEIGVKDVYLDEYISNFNKAYNTMNIDECEEVINDMEEEYLYYLNFKNPRTEVTEEREEEITE